jgi:hypothetical protein
MWNWPQWSAVLLIALLVVPLLLRGALVLASEIPHWSTARWDSAGLAPDPAATEEAVIQFYAARTWGWRGIFGVHTWVVFKPKRADRYTRYEVVGWGVANGAPAIRQSPRPPFKPKGADRYTRYEVVGWGVANGAPAIRQSPRPPDGYWAGNKPEVIADARGALAETLIERLQAAIRSYPYPDEYRLWPGPNSNTFTAYLARALPELHVELPPTAIGKDYLGPGEILASSPSGSGVQVSLGGLLGLTLGWRDGVEANVLGLVIGVDLTRPALKLPGLGRLGLEP